MPIPAGDLALQRSDPQSSKLYLCLQQPQYTTAANPTAWTGYEWSCRIDGAHIDDPTVTLTVDGGAAAWDLLDGQTILIGSSYGAWDKAVCRVRGDQTVGGATVALDIGTSSEIRGHVDDDDYVVVLDEFRFWQRFGRITVAAGAVTWFKDYDLEWDALGATDAARRLAMMPTVPIMGPHAVKFVEIGTNASTFYWDWQDSYAPAVGETADTWTSAGREDLIGNAWVSAAETPGWQATTAISGLRGLRTVLEVDDGNGNAASVPYRRGVRYVFTLRRPGETQPGDPENAEPITEFELAEPVAASSEQGYWRTSITVFSSEASKYNIMPEALVILFTEDTYTDSDGAPAVGSVGPITDRENILLCGRIVDGTILTNPETGDVTFDVASPGAEAATYHNYSIVVQNNDGAETWIDTPDLTVDRAIHYYTTWHTNLNQIADLYQIGSTIEVSAQDFLEGDIYSTLNRFMYNRLFARVLCDKYGRFHCEVDAQEQAFGSVTTLWTMQTADWLDEVGVRQLAQSPVNGTECWGLVYNDGNVTPKASHAPGLFDKYRGVPDSATSLAIVDQDTLNTTCGRHLNALNPEFEIGYQLAGNWRYCDIAPQRVVDIGTLVTDRQSLTGDYIIREVSNNYSAGDGVLFTEIQVEQEMDDGAAGVTIVIPDELPIPTRREPVIPVHPGLPPLPGAPAIDEGRRIIATNVGVFVTDEITAASPVWYGANSGFVSAEDKYVWAIARDPFHWWTSGGTERTLWAVSKTGVWKHENFPTGTWVQQIDHDLFRAYFGWTVADSSYVWMTKINMSIETDGRYVLGLNTDRDTGIGFGRENCAFVCQDNAIVNGYSPGGWFKARGGNPQLPVSFNHSSGTQTIYFASCLDPQTVLQSGNLYRSVNGGGAWGVVDGPYVNPTLSGFASLSVPYEDGGSSILLGSDNNHRISTDGGASFTTIPNLGGIAVTTIGTSSIDDRLFVAPTFPNGVAPRYSIDSGASWTTTPVVPVGFLTYASWTYWHGDDLQNILLGGLESGAPGPDLLYSYNIGDAAWEDKQGNLDSLGVTVVYDIDRDSMGSA